jgi:hypothetical protein
LEKPKRIKVRFNYATAVNIFPGVCVEVQEYGGAPVLVFQDVLSYEDLQLTLLLPILKLF